MQRNNNINEILQTVFQFRKVMYSEPSDDGDKALIYSSSNLLPVRKLIEGLDINQAEVGYQTFNSRTPPQPVIGIYFKTDDALQKFKVALMQIYEKQTKELQEIEAQRQILMRSLKNLQPPQEERSSFRPGK